MLYPNYYPSCIDLQHSIIRWGVVQLLVKLIKVNDKFCLIIFHNWTGGVISRKYGSYGGAQI